MPPANAHPKKFAAANHRRSKASIGEWNQFATANRHRHLNSADFNAHPHTHPEYEQTIHAFGHPAHSSNVRRLVTYPSKNNDAKSCEYGTYRDGQVVKCLRNPHHAPEGASHKRGAHTGNPMGRPRGDGQPPREEDDDDEIEQMLTRRTRGTKRKAPAGAKATNKKLSRESRSLVREKGWK